MAKIINISKELADGLKQFSCYIDTLGDFNISLKRGEENKIQFNEELCEITYFEKVWA